MKTILALLLVLPGLAANAAQQIPSPAALARTNKFAVATNAVRIPSLLAATNRPVLPAVKPLVAPLAPQSVVPAPAAALPPPVAVPATVPAAGSPAAPVTAAPNPAIPAKPAEETIPPGGIRFQNAPLEQVLEVYANMVNRTILRPASLPAANITINTKTELTRSEALQALDSVLGLNGVVMIPVGTKFIKVVPQTQAIQEGAMINTNDASALPELGTFVTHIVQLKYTKPSEVVTVLSPFAKMGPPLAIDSNGILIIRDYTENVKRMLELIAQIDVAVQSEIVSEVIPIKYALASDIAAALNSVGGTSSGSVGGSSTAASPGVTGRRTLGTGGPQTIGSPMTGNTMGGQPGIPVNRYGSTGAAGAAGVSTPTFAQRLQSIISKAATPGGAGDFQLIGPNKIIPDERTNSLLVFASRADMDMIKAIIAKLDVVLAQVLIEAIILDVSLGNTLDFGVSAGQQPKTLNNNNPNIVTGGAINNGDGSANSGYNFLRSFISGSGTNTTTGFPAADGLTYYGKLGPTWDVAITALSANNNVKVLARPSIQTSHAVPAQIFVGETRPYITGTYYNGYSGSGSQSQYQQSQIGISLSVTPLINPDGLVVMDIQQQVQQASPKGGGVIIDGNEVPITKDENSTAKVAVKNGETIVMGGFIQDTVGDSKTGIPLLKDIPFLGVLFRSTSKSDSRRELLVMIRPTVLPTPSAAALNTQAQLNVHPTLKEANAEFQKAENKLLKHANKVVKPETAFRSVITTNQPAAVDDPAGDKD